MSVKDDLIGAKGSSSSNSFRNSPDNLRSTDTFEALIGLGSGRIKGLAPGGLQNLFVDDVPIEDGSGNTTLKDFNAVLFDGDPTILQPIVLQLGGSSGPQTVNLPVNNAYGAADTSTPGDWRYGTVPQSGVDYIDLRFVVNSLYRQDKTGIYDITASLEIEFQPSGSSTWTNPLTSTAAPTYNQNGIPLSTIGYKLYALQDNWDDSGTQWAYYSAAPSYMAITGKTTQAYVKELRVAVPNTGSYANKTWQVRVRLRERDSYTNDQDAESRKITWESVAGVNTAPIGNTEGWRGLAYLHVTGKASDQLTGVPTISGIYDLSMVRVPPSSVWNAETRVYSGATWDGATEEIQWTQCPAFQMKDLIEDDISGISALTPGSTLNKWDTLEASKWFAQLVPNGQGGTHPRYSMNYMLDQAQSVNDLMQYVAGAVGSYAWDEGDGSWRLICEKPENATALFTKENIVGEFTYSHTDIDSRYNDLIGVFRNEARGFEEDRVRVFDQDHIDNYGRRAQSLALVGCTNRQEALRRLKIRQLSSLNETRQVSFVTNRQGNLVQPFSVILVADGDLASDTTIRTSGRLIARTSTTLTLRDTVRLEVGISYKVHVTIPNPAYNPDSTAQPGDADWRKPTITITRNVTNGASARGDVTGVGIDAPLPDNTPENAPIALEATGLPTLPKQYRVTDVELQDEELVTITAIEIYTNKWNESDNVSEDAILAQVPHKVIPAPLTPADGAMFTVAGFSGEYQNKRILTVRWDRPGSIWIDGFKVEYNLNNGPWQTFTEKTQDSYVELQQPQNGLYTFRITTLDRRGGSSQPLVGTYQLVDTAEDYAPIQTIGRLADRPSVGSREGDKYTTNDQNPNLTYIWSNGQWIEESNYVTNATQVTYQSGATLEALKPAQPGADVTATNTSANTANVGSVPAAQVVAVVQHQTTVDQNIADLQAAFGTTQSAAAARDAAVTAQNNAQTAATQSAAARDAANTARDNAANSASGASTSASTAQTARDQATQAKTDAQTAATAAGTSATTAASARDAATQAKSDAQTAVTAAQGARDQALTNANNAATSATNAGNSASAANGSATTASQKADAAGSSATAAAGSASTASTQAGNAQTYASNAATSASNASGSANSASTQAGLAAQSKTDAGNSATAAAGSASTASTQATNASNSASAAHTSELNASSSAGSAGTSATNAATSATNAAGSASSASTSSGVAASAATAATGVAAKLLPSDFQQDGTFYISGYSGNTSLASQGWTFVNVPGEGRVAQSPTGNNSWDLSTLGTLPIVAGRRYKATIRARVISGTGVVYGYFLGLAADNASYAGDEGQSIGFNLTTTWTTVSVDVDGNTMTNQQGGAPQAYVRLLARSNGNGAGQNVQLSIVKLEDITQSYNAAASASAAATSASGASASNTAAGQSASAAKTSETNASTSAGNANTYANNASTSATNAAGSATSASTQAGLAAQSKTDAGNSASAAAGSASTASTQATNAGNSASAARTSELNASSSAGSAGTSATNAATSATNAAGSANAASTSQTTAAGSAASALKAATATLPFDFSQDSMFWQTWLYQSAGNGFITPNSGIFSYATVSGEGRVGQINTAGDGGWLMPSGALRYDPTKTYRITLRFGVANDNSGVTGVRFYLWGFSSATADATTGTSSAYINNSFAPNTAFQTVSFDVPAGTLPIATTYVRPVVWGLGNPNHNGATLQVSVVKIEDVTAQTAAANSASAAATSASNASTSQTAAAQSATTATTQATNASTSAGNAQTYANNASTSANNASGSANTASTQAGNAATSATNAGNSATAAAGSASSASTSATNAGQSATAASGSATNAATSAGNASTSASNASTSATNAAGSANSAASQATVAASAAKTSIAAANFPLDFSRKGALYVTPDAWSGSNPQPLSDSLFVTTDYGNTFQSTTGGYWQFAYANLVPSAGRIFRYQAKLRALGADGTYSADVEWSNSTSGGQGGSYGGFTPIPVSAGWVTIDYGIDWRNVNWSYINFHLRGQAGAGGQMQVAYARLVDITSQQLASESAAASATSASSAAASNTAAGQSASAASTSATNAQTSAGNASTYASNASTSATNAAGSANTASTQAGVAASSAASAAGAATTQMKSPGAAPTAWAYNQWSVFTPTQTLSDLIANGTLSVAQGNLRNATQAPIHIHPKQPTPLVAGRRYLVTARIRMAADGSEPQNNILFVSSWDVNGNVVQDANGVVDAGYISVSQGIVTITCLVGTNGTAGIQVGIPTNATWVRPMFRSGVSNGAVQDVLEISLVDVEAQQAAAGSASAAATSASAASSSQTAAGGSASAASSSATSAQGYATNASGSATSAASSASTANSAASAANASASSAYSSASLSAQFGANSINPNPYFSAWSNGAYNALPDNWNWWDSTTPITRAGGVQGRPYSANFNNIPANTNSGLLSNLQQASFGAFVIEISGRATDWLGAGAYVEVWNGDASSTPYTFQLNCSTWPDTSGYTSNDGGGGAYTRTWSKLVKTNIDGAARQIRIFCMGNWDGFGVGRNAKSISFDRCLIRSASQAEIDGNTALGIANSNSAAITTEQQVRANADNAIASRTTTLEANSLVGGNLVPNSIFPSGNTSGWNQAAVSGSFDSWSVNLAGDPWHPINENNIGFHQPDGNTGAYGYWYSDRIPVQTGQWYQVSAYCASHRADVGLGYEFVSADNSQGISSDNPVRAYRGNGANGGRDLNGYDRLCFNIQATGPLMVMRLVKWGTNSGNGDSYAWFCRPQIVQVANGNAPMQPYTASDGRATSANLTSRVTTSEGAISNLNGRTSAYWQVTTVAGNNRAQLTVRADANGGAGVDIVGDVRISGQLITQSSVGNYQIIQGAVTTFLAWAGGASVQGDGTGNTTNPGSGSTGGGSFGGGGCVADDSYMPFGIRASDLEVGSPLLMLADDGVSTFTGSVEAISFIMQPCYRVETMSGVTLIASTTTPITCRDGSVIAIMHAGNKELPVYDEDRQRLTWEPVKRMDYIGERRVAFVTANQGTYAAGERSGKYILTHNKVQNPEN